MTTEDRESLEDLAEALDAMPREGDAEDVPEGSRYVKVSHTLLLQMADTLRRIAQHIDAAAPNDWD